MFGMVKEKYIGIKMQYGTGWIMRNRVRLRIPTRETVESIRVKLNRRINNDKQPLADSEGQQQVVNGQKQWRDTTSSGIVGIQYKAVYVEGEEIEVEVDESIEAEEADERMGPQPHSRWAVGSNGMIKVTRRAFFATATEVTGKSVLE